MLLQFGFNNLCSNYGDFNFFSKNIATFHPQKTLVVLCYSNLVSHQSGCCFLSLPFRLGIYNYFLPWEEDVCVLVNPIKVGNCLVFCYS